MGLPKTKKFPKSPKGGASLGSLENYKKKVDEIAKFNIAILTAYKTTEAKKKKLINDAKGLIEKSKQAKLKA